MSFSKQQFPIFSNNPGLIYLDSASTTQKPQVVIDSVRHYCEHDYSNIHRGTYDLAIRSEDAYENAKKLCARRMNVNASEIIFSFNATLASNTILLSLLRSKILQEGDEVIVCQSDHHATLVPLLFAMEDHGIRLVFWKIDEEGLLRYDNTPHIFSSRTKLVVYSHVSNVLGTIIDPVYIRQVTPPNCLIMVDASQSFAHTTLPSPDTCDIIIATGHKTYALTGIGILWIKKNLRDRLQPGFGGGGIVQEVHETGYTLYSGTQQFEPGTPDLVGAISLGSALTYLQENGGIKAIIDHEEYLIGLRWEYRLRFISHYPNTIRLIGPGKNAKRIGIFSLIPYGGRGPKTIGDMLAKYNICVRTGGHCAHPLMNAMKCPYGTVRVSMGVYTDQHDLQIFFSCMEEIVKKRKT